MNKKKEMLKQVEEFLLSRIEPNLEKLEKYLEENKDVIAKDFIEKLNALSELGIIQQRAEVKEPIKYLYISYLRSSILTESYEFRLDLFNDIIWLDKEETAVYWTLGFMFQYIEQDVNDAKELLRNEGPIPKFYFEEIKYIYSQCYFPFVILVVDKIIEEAMAKSNFYRLVTAESCKVLFGGYMEQAEIIQTINRGVQV